MEQLSFANAASRDLLGPTTRERILSEIRARADWLAAADRCAPHWPAPTSGRPPTSIALLLRFELVRDLWQIRSTNELREFVADSEAVRVFVGVDLLRGRFPGRATIDRFRQSMDAAGVLGPALADITAAVVAGGFRLVPGDLCDPQLSRALDPVGLPPGSRRSRPRGAGRG